MTSKNPSIIPTKDKIAEIKDGNNKRPESEQVAVGGAEEIKESSSIQRKSKTKPLMPHGHSEVLVNPVDAANAGKVSEDARKLIG